MATTPTKATMVITLQQFIAKWQMLPSMFYFNVWNFEVAAGKAAQSIFRDSFKLKRFNSNDGEGWAPRSEKNHRKHPLMFETGSLYTSIKWKHLGKNDSPSGVSIYTDPNGFTNTKRHQGFCYAAVHNGPSRFRTGAVRNMPRRQFMGHSSVLKEELIKLSPLIFQGFPK